jgi:hypothetical protein
MHAAKIIAHGGRARRPPPRTLQSPVAPSCCWRLSSRCRRGCRFCKVTEVGGCTSSPPLTFFNFIHDAFEQSSEAQTSSVTHSEPPSTHWLALRRRWHPHRSCTPVRPLTGHYYAGCSQSSTDASCDMSTARSIGASNTKVRKCGSPSTTPSCFSARAMTPT